MERIIEDSRILSLISATQAQIPTRCLSKEMRLQVGTTTVMATARRLVPPEQRRGIASIPKNFDDIYRLLTLYLGRGTFFCPRLHQTVKCWVMADVYASSLNRCQLLVPVGETPENRRKLELAERQFLRVLDAYNHLAIDPAR